MNHNNHGLLEIEIVVNPKLVVAINMIESCSAVTQIEIVESYATLIFRF